MCISANWIRCKNTSSKGPHGRKLEDLYTPIFTFLGIKWFLRDFQCLKGRIRKIGRNVLLQKKTDKDTLRKPFDPGNLLKGIDIKTVRR